jgi:hypothetical protein
MSGVVGPIVGGLLAITGGLLVALTTHRRERTRWQRDAQLRAANDLLSSLQILVRRMITVAYLQDKFTDDAPTAMVQYREATVSWNSAMYGALLVSPRPVAEFIPVLDREVDRLLDAAWARSWSRAEFRQERRVLGEMAAEYLGLCRKLAGFEAIDLPSVWSWGPEPSKTQKPTPKLHPPVEQRFQRMGD